MRVWTSQESYNSSGAPYLGALSRWACVSLFSFIYVSILLNKARWGHENLWWGGPWIGGPYKSLWIVMIMMIPVSVKQALLLGEPLPCNPEAETARQPLIWRSESLSSQGNHFPDECFFQRLVKSPRISARLPQQLCGDIWNSWLATFPITQKRTKGP